MAAKQLAPKKIINGIHTARNINLTLLSRHERFLNFNENIGISATINHEVKRTKTNK